MSFDFLQDKSKKIHFIGIGGISMSGLAEILLKRGYSVSGSDRQNSQIVNKLKNIGAKIYIGHDASNISKDIDLVVYTAAISCDNPELCRAKELNIKTMDRAEFLGAVMLGHKYNVAVAGTHGKTTTTSMLAHVVIEEKLDPTILVGGNLDIINGNVLAGESDYFVTEACEYKASFLKFHPYVGIILNIDADHLDYYKDINHIKDTFNEFINIIPQDGYLVCNADDSNVKDVLKANHKCNIYTYGINAGDFRAKNISYNNLGYGSYDLYNNDKFLFKINLSVPGEHNILNSLSVACTSIALNISNESIINGIASFKGTHRRFEVKGSKDNVTVIDDYAHHPTEITATLNAAKHYPHKELYVVFQPHTYTRTKSLFEDFSKTFDSVDHLLLGDIYAAREKDTGVVSSSMLGDAIRARNVDALNFHSFDEILSHLKSSAKPGDLIMTIGAGDIYEVGEMFLKK